MIVIKKTIANVYISHPPYIRCYNKREYSTFFKYPATELFLLVKPKAAYHVLTDAYPVCVLEALESEEDVGRDENWLTPRQN